MPLNPRLVLTASLLAFAGCTEDRSTAAGELLRFEKAAQEHVREHGSWTCPADHPLLREFVERILTHEAKAVDREVLGLTGVAGQPLRLLGERREDHPVCARLYREVPGAYQVRGHDPPDTVVFYRVANRYILALSSIPARPDERRQGPDQFMAYDLDLNKIGGMVY